MKYKTQLYASTTSVGMDNGRQRAHSASSLKSIHLVSPGGKRWSKQQTRSTPELRLYMQQSMLSGLNTTVPQSLIPQDFNSCHRPKRRPRVRGRKKGGGCNSFCRESCTVKLLLTILQLLLGATLTGVAFFLHFFVTESLKVRETSYWAGIPLFLAGVVGIYHCANEYESTIGSVCHFVVKAVCFLLSLVSIFICLVASTFPAIHIAKLHEYQHCQVVNNDCQCFQAFDNTSRVYTYNSLGDCDVLYCLVKILLITESVVSVTGTIISFWFVILLWRSKYGGIYSGIRYSSASNGHVQTV